MAVITERVYLVPGIMASELYLVGDGRQPRRNPNLLLWISPLRLGFFGQLGMLRGSLAAEPGPALDAGGPMDSGYGEQWRRLLRHQRERGFEAVAFGYDWRAGILTLGGELAKGIREDAAAGFTSFRIVAHSMGGLVARAAWRDLASTGQTGLVKRIVTLGTPHLGSYGPCRVFSGTDPSIVHAAELFFGGNPFGFPSATPARLARLRREIADVAGTWVSMYQLLPRDAAVLMRGNYPADIVVSTAGLTTHATLLHNAMDEAASKPPAEVLTMVYSTGWLTPWQVYDVGQLGRSDRALRFTDAGDGQVHPDSAAPSALAGRKYRVQVAHHQLPAGILHYLIDWLFETGPVPPDPVLKPDGPQPNKLTSNPLAGIDYPTWAGPSPGTPVFTAPHDC